MNRHHRHIITTLLREIDLYLAFLDIAHA